MAETTTADGRLDGNAAGGLLAEVFRREMTTALATCAGCGRGGAVGAAAVYGLEMGLVLRCPGCDGVLLRLTTIRGRVLLDLRGVSVLEIPA
jgi:hypothetical protein